MARKTKGSFPNGLHRGDIEVIRLCSMGAADSAGLMATYTGNNAMSPDEFEAEETREYISDIIDAVVAQKNIGLLPKHFEDMSRLPSLPAYEPLSRNGNYSRQIGLLVANTAFTVGTSAPPDVPRPEVGAKIITESAAALGYYMGYSMGIRSESLQSLGNDVSRIVGQAMDGPGTIDNLDLMLNFIHQSAKIPGKISGKMDGEAREPAYKLSVVSGLALARAVLEVMAHPEDVHEFEAKPIQRHELSGPRRDKPARQWIM